jgi:hypothetical protein
MKWLSQKRLRKSYSIEQVVDVSVLCAFAIITHQERDALGGFLLDIGKRIAGMQVDHIL